MATVFFKTLVVGLRIGRIRQIRQISPKEKRREPKFAPFPGFSWPINYTS
jgi:hypothetical protein